MQAIGGGRECNSLVSQHMHAALFLFQASSSITPDSLPAPTCDPLPRRRKLSLKTIQARDCGEGGHPVSSKLSLAVPHSSSSHPFSFTDLSKQGLFL